MNFGNHLDLTNVLPKRYVKDTSLSASATIYGFWPDERTAKRYVEDTLRLVREFQNSDRV